MKKIIILSVFFLLAVNSQAQDFDYWKTNNPHSTESINHQVWNNFLQINIRPQNNINLIDYANVSMQEKQQLKNYIDYLQSITITHYNSKAQKAYWINLYNALTVHIILEHYPVDSIRNIKLSGFFIAGPWKKKLVKIESKMLSLDNIEHNILRPIWTDNRVHYSVNCASIGCPNLQNQAFTQNNTEQLIEKGAREYIRNKRGVNFQKNKLILSSIYEWFIEDFDNSTQGIIQHLQKYASRETIIKLQNYKGKIKYDYDWSLNDWQ